MANYPSHPLILDSSQEVESSYDDDYSQPGIQHSRLMHAAQNYRFRLVHNLTLAQYNSLFATFTAGPRDVYTLTYHAESPVVTYSVRFTGPPQIRTNYGGDRFLVAVPLRGTKD